METVHQFSLAIQVLAIDALAVFLDRLAVECFESDQHAAAAGLIRQLQSFRILPHINRGLAEPQPLLAVLADPAQQLLGPNRVFFTDAEEVVIHHERERPHRCVPFVNDVGDAAAAYGRTVEVRNRAILATDRAAARGLNRGYIVATVDRLKRLISTAQAGFFQVGELAGIARLQATGGGLFDDVRPKLVAFADNDAVEVLARLIGHGRSMRAAHDRANALSAAAVGDFVRPRRTAAVSRQADQVIAATLDEAIC